MCFASSSAPAPIPGPNDYEYVDASGNATTGDVKGAIRRLKVKTGANAENILGSSWLGGNDSAGNSVGVGTDASGNGNAGSSASGW